MKKLYSFITFGIIVLFSLSLTSCNDDYDARRLAGYWEGEIRSVGWRRGTFNYVNFYFEKDPSYGSGHGWEYDYDEWDYLVARSYFEYEVVNGSLRLTYDSPRVVVWIDNWNISSDDSRLTAKFRYNGNTVTWSLYRIGGWRSTTWRNSLEVPFKEESSDSTQTGDSKELQLSAE